MPAGSTSFYFRTRKALLQGTAERLTELDLADLSRLRQLSDDEPATFLGTAGLARLVMSSASDPWLTRARARYELVLHASRDAALAETLRVAQDGFYELADLVVRSWYPHDAPPDPELAVEQARAVLTFVDGVIMSFVAGSPVVEGSDHLERLLNAVFVGVTRTFDGGTWAAD